jgi:hypothetical protein
MATQTITTHYNPLTFTNATTSSTLKSSTSIKQQRFTKSIPTRKRIFGEEFKELTILQVEPKAKILKLEQPVYEPLNLYKKIQDDLNNISSPLSPTAAISTPQLQETTSSTTGTPAIYEYIERFNTTFTTTTIQTPISSTLPIPQPQQQEQPKQRQQHIDCNYYKYYEPSKVPIPTVTARNYSSKNIPIGDIPDLCVNCYGVTCICEYFNRSYNL